MASSRTTAHPARAGWASSQAFARAWSNRGPPSAPRIVTRVAPRASAAITASSRSDSSLAAAASSTGIPAALTSASPAPPSESPSPTTRSGRSPATPAFAAPPSAAITSPAPASHPGHAASSAARDGTSPSPTRIACRPPGSSRNRNASAGRDGGVVWTPFAGMTRIRFRGSAGEPRTLSAAAALPCPTLQLGRTPTGARRVYTRPARRSSTQAATDGAVSSAPAARSAAASPSTESMPTALAPAARAIRMSSRASPT